MSIREEQCNKVCRILDDVLANRPTERDSLIVAVRKAFEQLGNSEQFPSEQPEIIYCRECRHWYTGDGYNHENGAQCELMHMWMGPDDYCSYGRRKVSE